MRTMKLLFAWCVTCVALVPAMADEPAQPATIEFGGGRFQLQAPEGWKRIEPRTRIIEHEFAIPSAEEDSAMGRMTLMGAGGGVEANIERWFGQFTQPDGASTKERAKVKKVKAAGQDVHLVDISGTYRDQRGPMAPVTELPKYRMLAAIVETQGGGNYFIKFYGPERTVAENEKAFVNMIEGLKAK